MTALAWVYLVVMALEMRGMPAMDMASAMASEAMTIQPWSGIDWLLMFMMWAVMMVGMMVPTAAPATLIYAGVARKAARQGTPVAPTALFVLGYVAIWTLFSAGATVAQWALDQAALLSPMMVTTSPRLGGALLGVAGVYQLTPYKDACLQNCRSPIHFISAHWRPGNAGAFRLGLLNGAYCLGCCWILMGLLFFGGVMSLMWIAGITFFVLAEKIGPHGAMAGRWAGLGLIALGIATMVLG